MECPRCYTEFEGHCPGCGYQPKEVVSEDRRRWYEANRCTYEDENGRCSSIGVQSRQNRGFPRDWRCREHPHQDS